MPKFPVPFGIYIEEVYEINNCGEQIKFELFKVIQNNFVINKREYKRMHGLHYNHQKKFTENKFKEWSKKARELRNSYNDSQIENFRIESQRLSKIYCENRRTSISTCSSIF